MEEIKLRKEIEKTRLDGENKLQTLQENHRTEEPKMKINIKSKEIDFHHEEKMKKINNDLSLKEKEL